MNITGLGSASWYTSVRSSTSSTRRSGESAATATDSALISAAGFAALMQQQQGPPEITDEAAAKIGATIAGKNQALFSALDADGNGTLNATELTSGMDTMRQAMGAGGPPPPPPPPEAAADDTPTSASDRISQLFSSLDSDGDGTLSLEELQAGLASKGQGGSPAMTDEKAAEIGSRIKEENATLFTALDTDQDGTLSAQEMEAATESGLLPPPPPSQAGGTSASGDDQLNQLLGSTGSTSLADFQQNLMQEILQAMFAGSAKQT